MTEGAVRATAVIVHFRGDGRLDACVASCLADPAVERVLIVDNEGVGRDLERRFAAVDDLVSVIQMGTNVGYGRAANAGLAASRSDAVLVLNQDVTLPQGSAVELLARIGEESGAWIVGPVLVDEAGRADRAVRPLPPPMAALVPARRECPSWQDVPWLSGAALLFMPGHTDLRFDERYFMYVEDEDLCARVWRAGGRVVQSRSIEVEHVGGTATAQRFSSLGIAWRILVGRVRMVRRHCGTAPALRFAAREFRRGIRRRL